MVASLDLAACARRQRRRRGSDAVSHRSTAMPSPSGSALQRGSSRRRRASPMPSGSVSRRCAFARFDAATPAAQPSPAARSSSRAIWSGSTTSSRAEAMRGRGLRARAMPAAARLARGRTVRGSPTCRSRRATRRRGAVYERLGFADAYAYHYRTPPRRLTAERSAHRPSALVEAEVHVHRTAPRRRSRPCRGCRAGPSAAPGCRCAKTKRSTRLVSLQACTSK